MHKSRKGSLGVWDSNVSQKLQLGYLLCFFCRDKYQNKLGRVNAGSQNLPTTNNLKKQLCLWYNYFSVTTFLVGLLCKGL